MNKIELVEQEVLQKKTIPDFKVGDNVRVFVKIAEEEGKTRLQAFEGIVIARKGSGLRETFTVRRISFGEGVERIFPLHSPWVDRIDVLQRGKVRRAKLNYLRKRVGKQATRVEHIEESETRQLEKKDQTPKAEKVEQAATS